MTKQSQSELARAQALLEKLEHEQNEPARKLAAARAEVDRLRVEQDELNRAERLKKLPKMAEPATFEAFRASADPLVARVIELVTELRNVLIECDRLVAQQQAVAIMATTEAVQLNVHPPVRVLGRGLIRGWILDALRDFGPFNSHLYLAFPNELERDAEILSGVNLGDVPPQGMTLAEYVRKLLDGKAPHEIHSAAREEEAAREREFAASQPVSPSLLERARRLKNPLLVQSALIQAPARMPEPPPPEAA